jgi:hypothetical protein
MKLNRAGWMFINPALLFLDVIRLINSIDKTKIYDIIYIEITKGSKQNDKRKNA